MKKTLADKVADIIDGPLTKKIDFALQVITDKKMQRALPSLLPSPDTVRRIRPTKGTPDERPGAGYLFASGHSRRCRWRRDLCGRSGWSSGRAAV